MEVELDMVRKIEAKNILDEVAQGKRWFITETVQYATIDVLHWMRCIQDEKQRFIDLNEKLKREGWEWSAKYAALQAERDELSKKYEAIVKSNAELYNTVSSTLSQLKGSVRAEANQKLVSAEEAVPESKPKTRSRNRTGTPPVAEAV